MKKRILAVLMAGVFTCAALSGCGGDSNNTGSRGKVEADDDDDEEVKEKKKDKEEEEVDEYDEEEFDADDEETDYRENFVGYWYAVDSDDLLYIDYNSDRWSLYEMDEDSDGELLGSGDYECSSSTIFIYSDEGQLLASFDNNNDGTIVDTETGEIFEYRMDGTDSRGDFEGFDSADLETGVEQFEGKWLAEGTDLVFYIYDDYLWAMYNTDGDFQNVNGNYTIEDDVITLFADDEIGSMRHTDSDTLVDLANGDVFTRWSE